MNEVMLSVEGTVLRTSTEDESHRIPLLPVELSKSMVNSLYEFTVDGPLI